MVGSACAKTRGGTAVQTGSAILVTRLEITVKLNRTNGINFTGGFNRIDTSRGGEEAEIVPI